MTPIGDLDWIILPKLLDEALELESQLQVLRALGKSKRLSDKTGPKAKKRKTPGLKTTDPW